MEGLFEAFMVLIGFFVITLVLGIIALVVFLILIIRNAIRKRKGIAVKQTSAIVFFILTILLLTPTFSVFSFAYSDRTKSNTYEIENYGSVYYYVDRGDYDNLLKAIESGESVDGINGFVPLQKACAKTDLESIKILVENGADINQKSSGGLTPVYFAINSFNGKPTYDVIEYMLSRGASFDISPEYQVKALRRVIESEDFETLKLILSSDIDVNSRASDGSTVLLLIFYDNSLTTCKQAVEILLENGADKSIRNDEKMTSLDQVKRWYRLERDISESKQALYDEIFKLLE